MSTRSSGSRQIRKGQEYKIRVEQAHDVLELEVRERPQPVQRVLAVITLLLLTGWFIAFVPRIINEPALEHIGIVAMIAFWLGCLNMVFPLSFERYRLGPSGLEHAFRNCLRCRSKAPSARNWDIRY